MIYRRIYNKLENLVNDDRLMEALAFDGIKNADDCIISKRVRQRCSSKQYLKKR